MLTMAIGGIGSLLNSYYSQANSVSSVSPLFDYKKAQKQTQSLLDSYKKNNNTVKTLKKESADFLSGYTKGLNEMNTAAGKLADGNIDKLLFDKDGNVTEETVKNTVDSAKNMVEQYNKNLKMLNDNADRGPGVTKQLARMADDPAPLAGMKMVGMSVNKDGSLALDEAVMAKALKDENKAQVKLLADIIGGGNGIASSVQRDARAGLNTPAQNLISNDLATMQSVRQDDPIRALSQSIKGGGAYAMNNNAAMGILMNMLV